MASERFFRRRAESSGVVEFAAERKAKNRNAAAEPCRMEEVSGAGAGQAANQMRPRVGARGGA